VVADALSTKAQNGLNTMINTQYDTLRGLENMGIEPVLPGYIDGMLSALEVQHSIIEEITVSQKDDTKLERLRQSVAEGKSPGFLIHEDGTLRFRNRLCVPNKEELKKKILEEAYNAPYSVHPGGAKTYGDLRQFFWWDNMKRKIAEYVDKCLPCCSCQKCVIFMVPLHLFYARNNCYF